MFRIVRSFTTPALGIGRLRELNVAQTIQVRGIRTTKHRIPIESVTTYSPCECDDITECYCIYDINVDTPFTGPYTSCKCLGVSDICSCTIRSHNTDPFTLISESIDSRYFRD